MDFIDMKENICSRGNTVYSFSFIHSFFFSICYIRFVNLIVIYLVLFPTDDT